MEQTRELRQFWWIVKKRFLMVFIIVFLTSLTAGVLNYMILEPVYKSSAVLMVNQLRDKDRDSIEYDDMLLNQKLVGAYVKIVKSKTVLRKTMKQFGYTGEFEKFSKKVVVTPMKDTGMIEIAVYDKDPKIAQGMASHISQVFMEEILNIMNFDNVQIIDVAEVESKPAKPKKLLNTIIAMFFGGVFAIIFVFMLEYFDNTIKNSNDAKKRLGMDVIGSVPDFGKMNEHIIDGSPRSPVAEAYRSIRTNLQFVNIDENMKVIAFTSPGKQEGKTTTVANIAMSLANIGKRVLIFDCDLRRPRVHGFFGISNMGGMTDYLLSHSSHREYIKSIPVSKVDVLTSGRSMSNPSEVLSSKRVRDLIEKVRDEYDYVIVDTPPVGLVTDAAVIASFVDGIVMVVASSRSDVVEALKAKEILLGVKANVIGVVMNRIEGFSKSYYEYYSDKRK